MSKTIFGDHRQPAEKIVDNGSEAEEDFVDEQEAGDDQNSSGIAGANGAETDDDDDDSECEENGSVLRDPLTFSDGDFDISESSSRSCRFETLHKAILHYRHIRFTLPPQSKFYKLPAPTSTYSADWKWL